MIDLGDLAWAGVGGSVGTAARFVLDGIIRQRQRIRPKGAIPLPLATMVINVTGSALLGLLTGLVLYQAAPTRLALIAGTGFCGGYTTFSTASYETAQLIHQKQHRLALINGVGTLLLSLAAAALGLVIGYA